MQQESSPLPASVQITVLLALTAGLFDPVPLARMGEAEQAVWAAAANIPAELTASLETTEKLSDAHRTLITELARQAVAGLSPEPDTKAPS